MEEDPYVLPAWVFNSSHAHDFVDSVFLSDEAIIEAMPRVEPPGKSYIIDLIFFPTLIVWRVRTLGRFLVRRLVAP